MKFNATVLENKNLEAFMTYMCSQALSTIFLTTQSFEKVVINLIFVFLTAFLPALLCLIHNYSQPLNVDREDTSLIVHSINLYEKCVEEKTTKKLLSN